MSLELSQEVENIVLARAAAEGMSVNELLARTFAPSKADSALPADPAAHVQALLARWQAEDNTPLLPPVMTRPGETPSQSLFRQWQENEARRTDAEKAAEDQLWADIAQGLRENAGELRLRTLGE